MDLRLFLSMMVKNYYYYTINKKKMIKLLKKWTRSYVNFCYIISKNALAYLDLMDSIGDINKSFNDKLNNHKNK